MILLLVCSQALYELGVTPQVFFSAKMRPHKLEYIMFVCLSFWVSFKGPQEGPLKDF